MKNLLLSSVLLVLLTTVVTAQNIVATLGGNATGDFYDVRDNNGNVLFRVNGTSKAGVGTTTLDEAFNINGNISFNNTESKLIFNGVDVLSLYSFNLFLGRFAGNSLSGGSHNTLFGNFSGQNLEGGSWNTVVGAYAGNDLGDAKGNTFVGYNSGKETGDGDYNTFVGFKTGEDNATGEYNVFVGNEAGTNNTEGSDNVFIGNYSGRNNLTGGNNVLIGRRAGYSGADFSYNVMLGTYSGDANTGDRNVFIGYSAGQNNTGEKNIFIGAFAGYNETGSNKLYIDNTGTSSPLIYGDFSSNDIKINGDLTVTGTITELSDRRYKTEIEPVKNALQKIQTIDAVYYRWDKETHPELVVSGEREIGVIAQDVEKVFPELVKTDENGFKSVNYAKLSAALLQAVKEQQQTINTILSKLEKLETQIEMNNSNNVNCKFVKK